MDDGKPVSTATTLVIARWARWVALILAFAGMVFGVAGFFGFGSPTIGAMCAVLAVGIGAVAKKVLGTSELMPRRRRSQYWKSTSGDAKYEIEFRWKEQVIYWEGERGAVFPGGWGVSPVVTYVPDALAWDRCVPVWLRGRRDEVIANLRAESGHVLAEEHDDSAVLRPLFEETR
jgi:hypothetical protein